MPKKIVEDSTRTSSHTGDVHICEPGMTFTTYASCSDQAVERARRTRHVDGWWEIFAAVQGELHAMIQLRPTDGVV
jgi:hypothetical protein